MVTVKKILEIFIWCKKIAKLIRVENDKRVEGGRIRSRFFYLKSLLEKDIVNASAQRQTVPRGTQAFRNFTERTNNNYMEKSHEAISRTIVNLLMRFYDIDSGKIMISNQNLGEMQEEHSEKNVVIVLQDTVLF